MHKHIKSADPRTRHADLYTAPAQPAAETEVANWIAATIALTKPNRVLELGTAFGHTAAVIARALTGHGGHLDTLEVNEKRAKEAKARCAGLPVTIHHADYRTWTPPGRYDLAFFDADREHRDEEYRRFQPFLNPGALLLFHDAGEQHAKAQDSIARLPPHARCGYIPCPRGLVIGFEPTG